MNSSHYAIQSNKDSTSFSFYSEGPKGKIQKFVSFDLFHTNPIVYSLALGDVDPDTEKINHGIISNNGDRDKILMTVAETVVIFCRYRPNIYVLAQGNSAARNRLYRMMISNHLSEIQLRFDVFGLIGNRVETFRTTQNYNGFLVRPRRIH